MLKELVLDVIEVFGRIDIFVNNVGINIRVLILEFILEEWQKVININLNGIFYSCIVVLLYMIKQKLGKIINVLLIIVKILYKNVLFLYGVLKVGVNYFIQYLVLEMVKYNICVNVVCFGFIEIDMFKQWLEEYCKQVLLKILLGRIGEV